MRPRIRAALTVAAFWATVWALVGIVLSPQLRVLAHASPPRSVLDRLGEGVWVGWYGFLTGLLFAGVLVLLSRRRTLGELTAGRVAGWGALASVLFAAPPYVYMLAGRRDGWRTEDPFYLGGLLVLTLGCALGSVLLARRAERHGAAT